MHTIKHDAYRLRAPLPRSHDAAEEMRETVRMVWNIRHQIEYAGGLRYPGQLNVTVIGHALGAVAVSCQVDDLEVVRSRMVLYDIGDRDTLLD